MSSAMIKSFGQVESLLIRRMTGNGEYDPDTGNWVDGTLEEIPVDASVQPMSGRELQDNYERGNDTREWIKIFTGPDDPLFTDRRTPARSADRVLWKGRTYKVMKVIDYSSPGAGFGLAYFRSEAVDAEDEPEIVDEE